MNVNCWALAFILVGKQLESSHPAIFSFAIFTDKIVMDAHDFATNIPPANVDQIVNQTDDALPIEMTNATGTYLQDLNEYCLLDIFSRNSLVDLCTLAETCKDFKQIIHRVFPQSFTITTATLFIDGHVSARNNYSKSYTVQELERILKNFGSRLSTLSLNDTDTNEAIVDLVAQYCGDVKMKRLIIDGMKSIRSVCRKLKSNFQRLQILYLRLCDVTECKSLDFNCDSLTELQIFQSTGCTPILKANFPNLKRFSYAPKSIPNEDHTCAVSAFIGRHRHLKTLSLAGKSIRCSSELVTAIGDGSELENLCLGWMAVPEISFIASRRLCLSKLRKLVVNIRFKNNSLPVALLQASTLLETLTLRFHDEVLVQVFDVLSQRPHLRELNLFCYSVDRIPWSMLTQLRKLRLLSLALRVTDALDIIKQLTNLEELCISYWASELDLTKDGFTQIVKIVEGRSNVLKLTCRCNFTVTHNCNKNRNVRLINLI